MRVESPQLGSYKVMFVYLHFELLKAGLSVDLQEDIIAKNNMVQYTVMMLPNEEKEFPLIFLQGSALARKIYACKYRFESHHLEDRE